MFADFSTKNISIEETHHQLASRIEVYFESY